MKSALCRRGMLALLVAGAAISCSESPAVTGSPEPTPERKEAPPPTSSPEAASASGVPREAPPLTVRQPGGTLSLADFKGKVVGLTFILTDCPHCQKFSKTLEKLYQELGPQGFQPLAVAINDGAGRLVRDFARGQGVTFPVGWTDQKTPVSFLQHPAALPLYMPQIAVIDRRGVIRYQHGGSDQFFAEENQEGNLREELEVLLAEK